MNIHDKSLTPKVTTGALPASKKVHSAPEDRPDIAVPLREIALSRPGPAGVPRLRHLRPLHGRKRGDRRREGPAPRAAGLGRGARRRRRATRAATSSRRTTATRPATGSPATSPTSSSRCAAPATRRSPRWNARAPGSSPTRWSTSPTAKTLAASRCWSGPGTRWPTARASARRSRPSSRRNSCATRWRAGAQSSRRTSTTPSLSR